MAKNKVSRKKRMFMSEDRILITNKQGKPILVMGNLQPARPRTVGDMKVGESQMQITNAYGQVVAVIGRDLRNPNA